MGDEADGRNREEQAIQRVTGTLVENFADTHSAERIERTVRSVRERFVGHPVREFVPILVERVARRELGATPAEERVAVAAEPVSVTKAASEGRGSDATAVGIAVVGDPAPSSAARSTGFAPNGESAPSAVSAPTAESGHPADSADGTGTSPADTPAGIAGTPANGNGRPRTGPRHAAPEIPTITIPAPTETTDDHLSFFGVARRWAVERPVVPLVVGLVLVLTAVLGIAATRPGGDQPAPVAAATPVTVRGLVGSEKAEFFADPRVTEVFARNGLDVQVEPAGSRQIATLDLAGYEFVFPSSATAADRIQREQNVATKYTPFSSPMAIATFAPIVEALTAAGAIRPGPVPTLDVARYLQLVRDNVEWERIPGNTTYPVRKNVLVSTTDPRTSNSAAMYLAVAGFVANDNAVVSSVDAERRVLPLLGRLFAGQGRTEGTSEGPFREYLSGGMGPAPLVWIYESQFVEAVVAGQTEPGMVLAYPSPTVLSQHTVIPLGDAGDRVGELLSSDPELQRLAAEHGFRTGDFAAVAGQHRVPVAADLIDVIDTPTSETLERMIDGVAAGYR
ncbi:three-helix bundle dimerization domain-containing protein [Nocardia sp. NPDC057353]|uniref:three-helix bundle dimerization domain-containing protein n=1 Tax=Nocardia sp. NPDC057353 TaxID=3346104 RepID=UPI003640EE1A